MAEWGRKESAKAWPSRSRAWAWGAVFLTGVFSVEAIWVDEATRWTEAEQLYLVDSLKSGTRGALPKMRTRYTLLEGVDGKGKSRLVLGDEIERIANVDGKPAYRLTATGIKDGVVRLEWTEALYNKHALHELLGRFIFEHKTLRDFAKRSVLWSLGFFVLLLLAAVPRDRARRMLYKHGRRLRGPELVTTAQFNEKLGKSKLMTVQLPEGGVVHQ
jgi:hypothetical protein